MTIKQDIEVGEAIIAEYQQILEKTELLLTKGSNLEIAVFLLDLQRIEYQNKIQATKEKLDRLKKESVVQFEADSAKCNANIDFTIEQAKKYIGKDPESITALIPGLIKSYNDDLPQDVKNDIYFRLAYLVNQTKQFLT